MRRILDIVNTEFPGDEFAVDILISDFEDAILLAMETAFPRARSRLIYCCFVAHLQKGEAIRTSRELLFIPARKQADLDREN